MFITTLPILFNEISILSYAEWVLLAIGLGYLIWTVTPAPWPDWQEEKPSDPYLYLHATWLGRVSLGKVFWPFLVLFNGMLIYIDHRAANGTYTMASWFTMHIIFALPLVYWTVAVWRASDKCTHKWQSSAARTITVLAYFEYAVRYIIWQEYPYTLFDCRQMMIQFGDCFFG